MVKYNEPPTIAAGDIATATDWNRSVRDNFRHVVEWFSWAPALIQGVEVGMEIDSARYTRIGTLILAEAYLSTSFSSGTSGQPIEVTYPVVPKQGAMSGGWARHFDSGNTNRVVHAYINTTTYLRFLEEASGGFQWYGADNQVSAGDAFSWCVFYEAAS